MSFLRPELADRLRRWSEPLACAAVLLVGLWLLRGAVAGRAWLLGLLALLLITIGGTLLAGAIRRVRLTDAPPGGGLVVLDEGRIGYFSPFGGGFIDLPSLIRVEVTGDAWVLTAEDARLTIPRGASGAEGLPDALSPLPGLDLDAAVAAVTSAAPGRTVIWRAAPGGRDAGRIFHG